MVIWGSHAKQLSNVTRSMRWIRVHLVNNKEFSMRFFLDKNYEGMWAGSDERGWRCAASIEQTWLGGSGQLSNYKLAPALQPPALIRSTTRHPKQFQLLMMFLTNDYFILTGISLEFSKIFNLHFVISLHLNI